MNTIEKILLSTLVGGLISINTSLYYKADHLQKSVDKKQDAYTISSVFILSMDKNAYLSMMGGNGGSGGPKTVDTSGGSVWLPFMPDYITAYRTDAIKITSQKETIQKTKEGSIMVDGKIVAGAEAKQAEKILNFYQHLPK